jgi:hypothetical protein
MSENKTGLSLTQDDIVQKFNELFDNLNTKFGLDIKLDTNFSEANTLFENKKDLEKGINESFDKLRVSLRESYLKCIIVLTEKILDPKYILSDDLSYSEKFEIISKLYESIGSFGILSELNTKDSNVEDLNEESAIQKLEQPITDDTLIDYIKGVVNYLLIEDLDKDVRIQGKGNIWRVDIESPDKQYHSFSLTKAQVTKILRHFKKGVI